LRFRRIIRGIGNITIEQSAKKATAKTVNAGLGKTSQGWQGLKKGGAAGFGAASGCKWCKRGECWDHQETQGPTVNARALANLLWSQW